MQGFFDSFYKNDCEAFEKVWDEEKLAAFKEKLELNGGKLVIIGTDGKEYEVTKAMVKIEMKTEKISGMLVYSFYLFSFLSLSFSFSPSTLFSSFSHSLHSTPLS